jgi:uncharacterized protein (TIGR03118 family)
MRLSAIYAFAGLAMLQTAGALAEEKPLHFVQHNFVANKASYKPDVVEKDFINGWGIAIRPAGAGGHFWVIAKDVSYEYVGDVQNSPDEKLRKLHTDNLKHIKLPIGGKDNFATGVVFSGSKEDFVITQKIEGAQPVTAPAKFLFASDGGIISAWTERKKEDGTFDRSGEAITVIDQSKEGAQFFGIALSHDYSMLYAADFGSNPAIKVFDGKFQPANIRFDMPFDDNKNDKVDAGEYAPFNIQALKTAEGENHIFVAYAKTQTCPKAEVKKGTCKKGELFVGEEDTSEPGQGRIAEFTEEGKLLKVWKDGGKLSAPWGFAVAPESWDKFAGALLVSNLGDGTIAVYDSKNSEFIDYIKDVKGKPIKNEKIWGILFGNGESLGDKDALYFAAGPKDEADGVFGSIRPVR